jgi:hypothetical protein
LIFDDDNDDDFLKQIDMPMFESVIMLMVQCQKNLYLEQDTNTQLLTTLTLAKEQIDNIVQAMQLGSFSTIVTFS